MIPSISTGLRHARTYSTTYKWHLSLTQPQLRQTTHQAVAHCASLCYAHQINNAALSFASSIA